MAQIYYYKPKQQKCEAFSNPKVGKYFFYQKHKITYHKGKFNVYNLMSLKINIYL